MVAKIGVSFWSADVELSDAEISALEAAGKVTLTVEQKATLRRAIDSYSEEMTGYAAAPRASELKAPLAEIALLAKKLGAALHRSPSDGVSAALRDRIELQALQRRNADFDLKELRKQIIYLGQYAESAAAGLPADIGRTDDPHIDKLIAVAHAVFLAAAGGKGKQSATSLGYLKRVVALAGFKVHSDEALRKRVKSALGKKA